MTDTTPLQRDRDADTCLICGHVRAMHNPSGKCRYAIPSFSSRQASDARLLARLLEPDIVEIADRAFYAAIHANDQRDCDPIAEALTAAVDALKGGV